MNILIDHIKLDTLVNNIHNVVQPLGIFCYTILV